MFNMAFSDEADHILINIIKDKEILWNTALPENKRAEIKRTLWDEVAAALGKKYTGTMCSKRFGTLRDNFYKNLRKVNESTSSGTGIYVPKWPLYEELAFLKNATRRVRGKSNMEELTLESTDEHSTPAHSPASPSPPTHIPQRDMRRGEKRRLSTCSECLVNVTAEPTEKRQDSTDCLLAFIGSKLREMEDENRKNTEKELLEIVLRKCYNK